MASTSPANDLITQDAPERKKRKRAAIIKFTFAGVALLGIGAAATSAAWTDDAWFSAAATTPTIQLQGGLGAAPVTWSNADTVGAAIVIPASAFLNLEPGVARSYQISIKNISTIPLIVVAPTTTGTGTIFTGANPAVISAIAAPGTLAANGTATVSVTVTPPLAWNGSATYQGQTGSITVQFQGTSS